MTKDVHDTQYTVLFSRWRLHSAVFERSHVLEYPSTLPLTFDPFLLSLPPIGAPTDCEPTFFRFSCPYFVLSTHFWPFSQAHARQELGKHQYLFHLLRHEQIVPVSFPDNLCPCRPSLRRGITDFLRWGNTFRSTGIVNLTRRERASNAIAVLLFLATSYQRVTCTRQLGSDLPDGSTAVALLPIIS